MLALPLLVLALACCVARAQEATVVNVAQGAAVSADSVGHYPTWHGHESNHDGIYEARFAVDGRMTNAFRWASGDSSPVHALAIQLECTSTLSSVSLTAGVDIDDDDCQSATCTGTPPVKGVCGYTLEVYSGAETTLAGANASATGWTDVIAVDSIITSTASESITAVGQTFRFKFDQNANVCSNRTATRTDNNVRIFEVELLGSTCGATDTTPSVAPATAASAAANAFRVWYIACVTVAVGVAQVLL